MSFLPSAYRENHELMKRRSAEMDARMTAAEKEECVRQFYEMIVRDGYDKDIVRFQEKAHKQKKRRARRTPNSNSK